MTMILTEQLMLCTLFMQDMVKKPEGVMMLFGHMRGLWPQLYPEMGKPCNAILVQPNSEGVPEPI